MTDKYSTEAEDNGLEHGFTLEKVLDIGDNKFVVRLDGGKYYESQLVARVLFLCKSDELKEAYDVSEHGKVVCYSPMNKELTISLGKLTKMKVYKCLDGSYKESLPESVFVFE